MTENYCFPATNDYPKTRIAYNHPKQHLSRIACFTYPLVAGKSPMFAPHPTAQNHIPIPLGILNCFNGAPAKLKPFSTPNNHRFL